MGKLNWAIRRSAAIALMLVVCIVVYINRNSLPEPLQDLTLILLWISLGVFIISISFDIFKLVLLADTKVNGTVVESTVISINTNAMGYSCAIVDIDGIQYESAYYYNMTEQIIGSIAHVKIHPLFRNFGVVELDEIL